MKASTPILAVLLTMGCALSHAVDVRDPFSPTGVRTVATPAAAAAPAPVVVPPVLPPPLNLPPQRAEKAPEVPPPPPDALDLPSVKASSGRKTREAPSRSAAAACTIKVKSQSVAAPSTGGVVTISLQGGGQDCVSAVLVEQSWLEARDLSDPSAIRLEVDANDTATPRQSNIILANAAQSVTITLVQEGRSSRAR